MSVAVKRNPSLWEESKKLACSEAGLCLHSARKMQWAVRHYKQNGGTYAGRKERHNKLRRWTREKWRTHSGKRSEGKRRYLPSKAWDKLTPSQVRRTNRSKRKGFARGKQYVAQPKDVAAIASAVRAASRKQASGR